MTFRNMVGALWYLQSRSVANAVRVRVRRLKQPRYLIGAVMGFAYFASIFGRSFLTGRFRRPNDPPAAEDGLMESVGAAVLLVFLLMSWFFAKDRAALTFSEAEVANLFPAPLSRRLLLIYRILRGQAVVLFSTLIIMLFTGRMVTGFNGIFFALGWWVILSVLGLHGIGASFAVQRLTERGMASGTRRLLTAAIPSGVLVLLWFWYLALPQTPAAAMAFAEDPSQWRLFSTEVFHSGPAPWLLWPFRLVVRPLFAQGFGDGLTRLLPAVGLLGLHVFWVLQSAVSFEETSIDQSRKMAELRSNRRAGSLKLRPPKRVREPFALRPTGPGWVALWWSGLIESRESPRRWFLWIFGALVVVVAGRLIFDDPTARMVLSGFLGVAAGIMILMGGQSAAQRFARALRDLDVVKALPIPGWQVFLGSVLGGLMGIVFLEELLLVMVAGFLVGTSPADEDFLPLRHLSAALISAGILAPVGTLFFAIPVSLGYVFFPGWFAVGRTSQDLEATGQRMLVGVVQLGTMALAVVPVLLVGAPAFLLGTYLIGPAGAIVLAAMAGTVALAAECAAGVWWIGRRFDALDAAEER